MVWPVTGCRMQLAAFQVLVDRLSVLLEVKLRPPVKPSRCLDRNLSSWVDWKTVEVAVAFLVIVPVCLGLTGLLVAVGGPWGLLWLVPVPAGMTAAACDPLGCPVAGGVALGGAGGHAAFAAMAARSSSRSWYLFRLRRTTTSLPPRLTAPSQWLIFQSKIPTWSSRKARSERMSDNFLFSP